MSKKHEPSVDRVRRRLLGGLAAAPLAGAFLPGMLAAPAPRPRPEEAETGQEGQPGPHRDEAEALLEVVSKRYGKYLEGDQASEVRASLERSLGAAAQMSAVGLANHEEPDFVFSPYREEDDG